MFEDWKQELIRKHFDGEKERGVIPDDEKTIAQESSVELLNTRTDFDHERLSGKDEESNIKFLCEEGWESDRVQPKECGLNVLSIILICRRDFFYQEPLWGKRAGGGAMWKGAWDWLVARSQRRTLKWWGHSSVANQVNLIHSKHCLSIVIVCGKNMQTAQS